MTQVTEVKIQVGKRNKASIICPQCGKHKEIDTSEYQGKTEEHKMNFTCDCGFTFEVSLNFREYYNKDTWLYGPLSLAWTGIKLEYYRKDTRLYGHCYIAGFREPIEITVENLSTKGIGFTTGTPVKVSLGDMVEVEFVLKDKKRSLIRKKVTVRRIINDYIAAEFHDMNEWHKDLGFYLKP